MGTRSQRTRAVVNKVPGGNDNFYSETYSEKGKDWVPTFKLGPRRSALANLPEDESKFPVATWLKALLSEGVQQLILNSLLIRQASPPGRGRTFRPDGSNLPWMVAELEREEPDRIDDWVAHLQTALPDLESIRTVERPDDKHRYLMLRYRGGVEIPSWMASDGTLRLLALTLPAYLPDLSGIYLIEEPENGIHPRVVETMFQSLSSVYDAQILLASHSPVILSLVEPRQLLCFAKTEEGATDIVLGSDHPVLREWRGETNLSTLFASGVLGWANRDPDLRSWLLEEGYLDPNATKPARPKEAVEKALRIARKPRSSALYRQLAERVSLRGCEDPAFGRFCEVLQGWFPSTY